MAKLNTDYLFTLIKSLTKAEKRYFKVYGSTRILKGENIYFKLFNAIEAQKTYDENKIKEQNGFKDLPTLKKRLYKAILKSLAEFHSSVGIEVREMIDYIEILFNKSLFNHCMRQINKVKKIVAENEQYEEWLEILRWEYKIAVKRSSLRYPVLEEEKKIFLLLNNQKKYRDTANLFMAKYQRFGTGRNPREMRGMERIISSPLLKDEMMPLSFNAKQNFYDCHSLFSIIKGNYRNSYNFGKKSIDLYLKNQSIIWASSFSYLARVNNFLITCLELKEYDQMLIYLDQLEKIRKDLQSPSEQATAFFYLYHLLNHHIYTGLFEDARSEVKRIEEELPEHEDNLNTLQKTTLYAIIAQVYFGLENYKRCLFWLNRILSFGEIRMRADLECFIRLFHLIVHYEARSDKELMGSLLKSTYRFFNKHEQFYKFERAIMDFFRQYILSGTTNQDIKLPFIVLKKRLEELSKDPYEKQALNYFDFISWLDSKIENRTFAEVMKEKAER
jgi:hypothetical protein